MNKKVLAFSFVAFFAAASSLYSVENPAVEKSFLAKWNNGKSTIEITKDATGIVVKVIPVYLKETVYPAYIDNSILFIKKPGTTSVIAFAVVYKENELLCKITTDDSISYKKVVASEEKKKESTEKKAVKKLKKLL